VEVIIKELMKLKLKLEHEFAYKMMNGYNREQTIKELNSIYTKELWRIL
jgi:hypothetical protein